MVFSFLRLEASSSRVCKFVAVPSEMISTSVSPSSGHYCIFFFFFFFLFFFFLEMIVFFPRLCYFFFKRLVARVPRVGYSSTIIPRANLFFPSLATDIGQTLALGLPQVPFHHHCSQSGLFFSRLFPLFLRGATILPKFLPNVCWIDNLRRIFPSSPPGPLLHPVMETSPGSSFPQLWRIESDPVSYCSFSPATPMSCPLSEVRIPILNRLVPARVFSSLVALPPFYPLRSLPHVVSRKWISWNGHVTPIYVLLCPPPPH